MAISDGNIYVNYGNVGDIHDALVGADQAIQGVLQNLEEAIAPLRASWSGASEQEYIHVQARWNDDIGQMNALLGHFGNTLDEMSTNYGTTDNHIAGQWQSING
jgi:early secretory antigenic target protein ESAT-6